MGSEENQTVCRVGGQVIDGPPGGGGDAWAGLPAPKEGESEVAFRDRLVDWAMQMILAASDSYGDAAEVDAARLDQACDDALATVYVGDHYVCLREVAS